MFHKQTCHFPAAIEALAEELFEDTKVPQPDDHEPHSGPSVLRQETSYHLQRLLQSTALGAMQAAQQGVDLIALSRPPEFGTPTGDFFQVIQTSRGELSLFIGDAVGHNTHEAWENSIRFKLFVQSKQFIDEAYSGDYDARSVLSYIDDNCNFRGDPGEDAVVASHILLNPKTGNLTYANAGNAHYLAILEFDGGTRFLEAFGGRLAHPDSFPYNETEPELKSTTLKPLDVAFIVSDGVQDGFHHSGELMSKVLPKLLGHLTICNPPPELVVAAVLDELKSTKDDLTVMAFSIRERKSAELQ